MTLKNIRLTVSIAAVALVCTCGQSFGGIIARYDVTSTNKINNSHGAKHGLWTSGDDIGSGLARNYWDVTSMEFTHYDNKSVNDLDDDFATLKGSVQNLNGDTAYIDLMFTGFESNWGSGHYKNGSGQGYQDENVDFFKFIDNSTNDEGITADNKITFSTGQEIVITQHVSPFGFQFGYGANDKEAGVLGGSAWIRSEQFGGNSRGHGNGDITSDHWDLNLNFQQVSGGSGGFNPVPEPASALVWSTLALATLVQSRRRRRAV